MGKNFDGIKRRVTDGRRKLAQFVSPDKPEPIEQPGSEGSVALRSLSPQYIEEEHGGYVDVLVAELQKLGNQAPLNIALTGHYGSGKSSVIMEAQSRLEKGGARVINLSMPSLGVGEGRLPRDGDTNIDRTNLIQKEIIKQLLYRRSPSETPASRYNRLDTFRKGPAYRRGAVIGLLAALVAALMGVPERVQKALPQTAWRWLDKHVASAASEALQWASLLLVLVLVTSISIWLQRVLHQRLRVSELVAGTGPAKVTLSKDSSSYFDEYLDEIVYFSRRLAPISLSSRTWTGLRILTSLRRCANSICC